MSPIGWLALALVWLIDTLLEPWRERRTAAITTPVRHTTPPPPPVPEVAPPPVVDPEQLQREAMHALHRQRAEEQTIATLLRSIDTAGYPFTWRDAQRMAAEELGVTNGLVFVERARLRFIELGGGERPPFVGGRRVLEPVAMSHTDDALDADMEARAARLLGWLADTEERC